MIQLLSELGESCSKPEELALLMEEILDKSCEPFVLGNLNGRFIYCNKAFSSLVGYSLNELNDYILTKGTKVLNWYEKEFNFNPNKETGLQRKQKIDYINREGSSFEIELSLHEFGQKGEVRLFYSFFKVISEQLKPLPDINYNKNLELAKDYSYVQDVNIFLSKIVNSSPIMMSIINQNRVYTHVNKEWKKVMGYTGEEVIGKTIEEIGMKSVTCAKMVSDFQNGIKGNSYEVKFYTKQGEERIGLKAFDEFVYGDETYQLVVTQDITENKRLEEKAKSLESIKAEKRWLKGVIDSLPVGIFLANSDGAITDINDITREIWGGEVPLSEEPSKYGEYKGWWPDSGKQVTAEEWALARALQKGETSKSELINILRFDGKRGTIINNAAPVLDSSGAIDGAVVVIQDITYQTMATELFDQALKEISEEEFYLYALKRITSAPGIGDMASIYLVERPGTLNLRTTVGKINEGCYEIPFDEGHYWQAVTDKKVVTIKCAVNGLDICYVPITIDKEVLGVLSFSLNDHKNRAGCMKFINIAAGILASFIKRKKYHNEVAIHRDNLESLVAERTYSLAKANERLHEEIVERLEIEKSLKASELRFRKVFNTSPVMKCVTYVESNKITEANNIFLSSLEYERDEVIGKSFGEVVLIRDAMDREYRDLFLQKGLTRNMEVRFVTRLGEERNGLLSLELIDFEGQPAVLVLINDITEYIKFKEKVIQLDRFSVIGEMAAGMSHEVRNPLTAVRGFLQLFALNKSFSDYKEQIDLMISELDRANAIISEFLSIGKTSEGSLQKGDINKVLLALEPLILADAFKNGQSLVMELGEVPQIFINDKEIRQVILNLTLNAFDANRPGGQVKIKTHLEGDKMVLAVLDQGHGIPEIVLKKIGTPFVTTKEKGTGLGLAICYGIMQRHGGEIIVDTGPEGTTFSLYFSTKKS